MAQANTPFEKRTKKIVRKHEQLAKGSVKRMRADGLIVEQPRVFRMRFPARGLALSIFLVFLVKGFLIAAIGETAYAQHLASVDTDRIFDRAAGWLLQMDAVSVFIADLIAPLIQ